MHEQLRSAPAAGTLRLGRGGRGRWHGLRKGSLGLGFRACRVVCRFFQGLIGFMKVLHCYSLAIVLVIDTVGYFLFCSSLYYDWLYCC